MKNSHTTTEILIELNVPFWRLEYLVRAGKVKPIQRGRGRERRFTPEEFEKARNLLRTFNMPEHQFSSRKVD